MMDLVTIYEGRRFGEGLLQLCPDAVPGTAVYLTQQAAAADLTPAEGYGIYLALAGLREVTQGEG
jgi:hypothetical protein